MLPNCEYPSDGQRIQVLRRLSRDQVTREWYILRARGKHLDSRTVDDGIGFDYVKDEDDWVEVLLPVDWLNYEASMEGEPSERHYARAQIYAWRESILPAGVALYSARSSRTTRKAYVTDGNHRVYAAVLRGCTHARMFMAVSQLERLLADYEEPPRTNPQRYHLLWGKTKRQPAEDPKVVAEVPSEHRADSIAACLEWGGWQSVYDTKTGEQSEPINWATYGYRRNAPSGHVGEKPMMCQWPGCTNEADEDYGEVITVVHQQLGEIAICAEHPKFCSSERCDAYVEVGSDYCYECEQENERLEQLVAEREARQQEAEAAHNIAEHDVLSWITARGWQVQQRHRSGHSEARYLEIFVPEAKGESYFTVRIADHDSTDLTWASGHECADVDLRIDSDGRVLYVKRRWEKPIVDLIGSSSPGTVVTAEIDRLLDEGDEADRSNPTPAGDCFRWAYNYVFENRDATLVHAQVTHPWDNAKFWHAWAEHNDYVLDWQTIEVFRREPKTMEAFYETWRPTKIRKYNFEEAAVAVVRYGHFGPWVLQQRGQR